MLGLSAVFMLDDLRGLRDLRRLRRRRAPALVIRPRVLTWMRRAFAAAFVALGVKLAFTDR